MSSRYEAGEVGTPGEAAAVTDAHLPTAVATGDLAQQVEQLRRELDDARRQQAATAEVLRTISQSSFDLQSALERVTVTAAQLCQADMASIARGENGAFYHVTSYNFSVDWIGATAETPLRAGRDSVIGRSLVERAAVQIADVLVDPEYAYHDMQRQAGFRTCLAVPLLRDGEAIGVFFLARRTVQPFSRRQIELLSTFADQAVIAIENARLLTEVESRTRELTEALERQTATSEVLGVISRSKFDIQPVLDTIVQTAGRLCQAEMALIYQVVGDEFRVAAHYGDESAREYLMQNPLPSGRGTVTGRVLLEGRALHVPDVLADPDYTWRVGQKSVRHRTILGVPLIRDGKVLGSISVTRSWVEPFTEKQIELITTFADQASIAIENVRLFEEVQARTRELTEALARQTATSEVLSVISRSKFDIQPVMDMIAATSARLCQAELADIARFDGSNYSTATTYGYDPDSRDYLMSYPVRHERGNLQGRVLLERRTVHIADCLADPDYTWLAGQRVLRQRTMLGVPLLRGSEFLGAITLMRREVRPFSETEIELVTTFADQAVIAIENVRLFEEVQARTRELSEALERQTATAHILGVINHSGGDLRPVFTALLESAVRICAATFGILFRYVDGRFETIAMQNVPPAFADFLMTGPLRLGPATATGRAAVTGQIAQIADLHEVVGEADAEARRASISLANMRTVLAVPMLRENEVIGVISIFRQEAKEFTAKQMALLGSFADQAVIAVENARLLESLQSQTRALERSLEELRSAQDRLVQTEKLASLGQLTAGIAHEIKNPLNFINNFAALSSELVDELSTALRDAPLEAARRNDIEELATMLRGNLDRVVQHGKRADSIVRNMLLHSRQGGGERRPVEINGIVEESLNLAYHGARAEKPGFNVTIERSLDPAAGRVELYPQEFTRVLLNLIANGFYAVTRRKAEAGNGYEPTLSATTRDLGDSVEIRIRDNGTGIPPQVKERLFTPFFTTKPAGEGTGLGLSLSHDIVVKQHGGAIEVATEPGSFTEFRILLPRTAASRAKAGEPA